MLRAVPGLTSQQSAAAAARGNVLVMAGAGTGKTRTLVERCLQRLLDPVHPTSLEAILVVTFTEAAAAETRQRIRARLAEEAARQPGDLRLREAVALADTAAISTLHGFCLALIREHFHELGVDPRLAVLDTPQADILAQRTLEAVLRRRYTGDSPADLAVQELVMTHGGGSDGPVRDLVLRLHDYARTLPDPAGWLREHRARLDEPAPRHWQHDLLTAFGAWRREWIERLGELAPVNARAAELQALLGAVPAAPDRDALAAALVRILARDGDWPKGRKTELRKPLERLFDEARFLADVAVVDGDRDPLAEDWNWVRPHLAAVLDLAADFGAAFDQAKREGAAVDFHDLEQLALRLLWDPDRGAPTVLAHRWRERLEQVFVDEYQDINAAQDCLLRCLSREGDAANRFLVGDVKQSIYRFRLANPAIFQAYAAAWGAGRDTGRVFPLNENFRSRPAILACVNAVFAALMRRELGGVEFDPDARLSTPRSDALAALPGGGPPAVELLLSTAAGAPGDDLADADDERGVIEREAAMIAGHLRHLREAGAPVWDESQGAVRPVEWRDMVVLLRAPASRTELYAREFARAGVPLAARRTGLYATAEVRDLLSLLQLLDNPLQDLPTLAVLRSPLAGLTLDELAAIRLTLPRERFWTALARFHETAAPDRTGAASPPPADDPVPAAARTAWPKVDVFLRRFAVWRELARFSPLSQCLEAVLDDTRFEQGLLAQPRGAARLANVRRLLEMARDFDRLQRQGLYHFLQLVQDHAEVEFDPEPAQADDVDAVRLMSIHQSKGLEFPVVVVADLAKPFNLRDLSGSLLLDDHHGLAPMVRPPGRRRSYPSLAHWLAARRGRRETLGEELRLLYVALTRARDRLVLSAGLDRPPAGRWPTLLSPRLGVASLAGAGRCLDWLGPLLPTLTGRDDWHTQPEGSGPFLDWRIVGPEAAEAAAPADPAEDGSPRLAEADLERLCRELEWIYPHGRATVEPAKASVTALRRRAVEAEDEEAAALFARWSPARTTPSGEGARPLPSGGAERGTAHHRLLERISLPALASRAEIENEVRRLVDRGLLEPAQAAVLDLDALAAFGASDLGGRVIAAGPWVRRELGFTARLSPADFASLGLPVDAGLAADEFVVVQGVVDLAVIEPDELWIVDFKTDQVRAGDLGEKAAAYAPQLRLYALALGRIHRRRVTGAWLHFLGPGRSVPVPLPNPADSPAGGP